jgi:hypothetical protein
MAVTIGSIADRNQGVTHILSVLGYYSSRLFPALWDGRFGEMPSTVKIGRGRVDSKTQVGSAHERR